MLGSPFNIINKPLSGCSKELTDLCRHALINLLLLRTPDLWHQKSCWLQLICGS
jgi:hypothetical protein